MVIRVLVKVSGGRRHGAKDATATVTVNFPHDHDALNHSLIAVQDQPEDYPDASHVSPTSQR